MSTVYIERIVCFLDILGFREKVRSSVENNNSDKILKVLELITEEKNGNYTGTLSLKEIGREVSVFSDSIVISYPIDHGSSLFYIIMDIIHMQIELLNRKILVRGGISIGDLYHNDSIVFGPALIDAIDIESKHAIYPRIMISEDILIRGLDVEIKKHGYNKYNLELLFGLLVEDENEFYYIDYLSQWDELDEPNDIYILFGKLEDLIRVGVKSTNPGVKRKYEWLVKYLDFVRKKMFDNSD